jgi:hypothetical protein
VGDRVGNFQTLLRFIFSDIDGQGRQHAHQRLDHPATVQWHRRRAPKRRERATQDERCAHVTRPRQNASRARFVSTVQ